MHYLEVAEPLTDTLDAECCLGVHKVDCKRTGVGPSRLRLGDDTPDASLLLVWFRV